MLTLRHVSETVNHHQLLSDINLTIHDGEHLAIIGPSGSGKASLLQLINGVTPFFTSNPIEGDLKLNDKDLRDWSPNQLSQCIGNVFQDPRNQFFAKNVEDELLLRLGNFWSDPQKIAKKMAAIIDHCQLSPLLHQSMTTLSSGQKQRVAVAVAMATQPQLLIMDEPSANLDLNEVSHLGHLLTNLPASTSLVVAEHRLFYLLPLIDRFVYLENGQIKGNYSTKALMALPEKTRQKMGLRALSLTKMNWLSHHECEPKSAYLMANHLTFRYQPRQKTAIDQLDFTLNRHESIGLIGPNGIGKSTFAKVLAGLIRRQAGSLDLDHKRASRWQLQKHIWYVMQETTYQLFADSVWNELFLNLTPTPERVKAAKQLLADLGLSQQMTQHPATLSGGQKQRLVLGTALLHHPDVLILDEPSSGLEQNSVNRMIHVIQQARQASSLSLMTISHDPQFLAQICQKLLILKAKQAPELISLNTLSISDYLKAFQPQ